MLSDPPPTSRDGPWKRLVGESFVPIPALEETQMAHHLTERLRACIKACRSCHDICIETISHCLMQGGTHASPEHMRTLMDCAQICETSADFMLRESELHPHVCAACAEVCERCAVSCESLGGAEMKRCAEECRRCANQCRAMSQAVS